jgi:hypothetical protein
MKLFRRMSREWRKSHKTEEYSMSSILVVLVSMLVRRGCSAAVKKGLCSFFWDVLVVR